MLLRIVFTLLLISLAGASFAQSKKKKRKEEAEQQLPSSVEQPTYPKKDYTPKKKKRGSPDLTFESQEEYQDRMQALVKTKRKNERLMEDPQYSDPMYFGHKRPPKKRKPGKMKYCKVCGIRH